MAKMKMTPAEKAAAKKEYKKLQKKVRVYANAHTI